MLFLLGQAPGMLLIVVALTLGGAFASEQPLQASDRGTLFEAAGLTRAPLARVAPGTNIPSDDDDEWNDASKPTVAYSVQTTPVLPVSAHPHARGDVPGRQYHFCWRIPRGPPLPLL
jgi:hypothetical protein